ncbi:MAG: hypothetical protein ACK5LC_00815, partial [Coprobacillaceae bacterium]
LKNKEREDRITKQNFILITKELEKKELYRNIQNTIASQPFNLRVVENKEKKEVYSNMVIGSVLFCIILILYSKYCRKGKELECNEDYSIYNE